MPRLPSDFRISLKKPDGPTHRIELVRQPVGRRYWVRRDGKYSTKVPEATATQIAECIRRRLVVNAYPNMAVPGDLRLATQMA